MLTCNKGLSIISGPFGVGLTSLLDVSLKLGHECHIQKIRWCVGTSLNWYVGKIPGDSEMSALEWINM